MSDQCSNFPWSSSSEGRSSLSYQNFFFTVCRTPTVFCSFLPADWRILAGLVVRCGWLASSADKPPVDSLKDAAMTAQVRRILMSVAAHC